MRQRNEHFVELVLKLRLKVLEILYAHLGGAAARWCCIWTYSVIVQLADETKAGEEDSKRWGS
jgi:hypothetical protein